MTILEGCAIFVCVLLAMWTWAMLIAEDQGESKLERLITALEDLVEMHQEANHVRREDLRRKGHGY